MPAFRLERLSPAARSLWTLLDARGTTWLVGGAVRDLAAGLEPHDVDLATALRPGEVRAIAQTEGLSVVRAGEAFGRIGVVTAHGLVDVTTFREEAAYLDGRHPEMVRFTGDGVQDLRRRDFTMNAMALTAAGRLVDPTGGLHDLQEAVIRAVGDPARRLDEDHLRVLRAIRFLAYPLGPMRLDPALAREVAARREVLKKLSAARLGSEFGAMLSHATPDRALIEGARLGLWAPSRLPGQGLDGLDDPGARLLALSHAYELEALGSIEWPHALRARARGIARILAGVDPVAGSDGVAAQQLAHWLGEADPARLLRPERVMGQLQIGAGPILGQVLREQRRYLKEGDGDRSPDAILAHLQRFLQNLPESSD